jgi:sphingomyelin phosphodiesterase
MEVIHFSDVHIDRFYTTGSEANCTKPICCRNFADQTGPVTVPAGPNGNSACDSPVSLADSMLSAAQQFGSSSRFSVFTGDVVEGN